ncbi:hypothetical protein Tsubulata_037605 [Turnera subulata]|uniref:NB-ARC domain-containing protein n=1 Tax=Turnera subulata TaxID=218843 RepID=A0A9Q0F015_9ROSI|nr:hypothetical protein Tsubulata_037605 [Turnera subulata]
MAFMKVEERQKILDLLKRDDVKKVVLVGDAGVGKTWMAQKVRESAINEEWCYAVLWVSMNAKLDIESIHKNIASQLSIPFSIKTVEEADFDDEELESLDTLKKEIQEKLNQRRKCNATAIKSKSLLVILDDEGSQMSKENLLSELNSILGDGHFPSVKLLISKRKAIEGETVVIPIEHLPPDDSLALLNENVAKSCSSGSPELFPTIVQMSQGLPSAIILTGEAINYFKPHDSWEQTLESALKMTDGYEPPEKDASLLLNCVCDMLPSDETCLINCFWHCTLFFPKFGGVHYNELIAHWIMEGYFDPISHVEEAYEKGHSVLKDLLDRGILQIQDDDVVIMDGALQNVRDQRREGYGGTSGVGLISLDGGWNGFGRITPTNGMIKTLCSDKKVEKISTLLIDGSHLWRKISQNFFQKMNQLEILAVFDANLSYLRQSLSQFIKNLAVLVLKGSNILLNIDQISELEGLTVLEVSGASFLEEIREDFFKKLTKLQSLNLSRSRVTKLPSTLANLSKLRFLILRKCLCLETLPTLKALTNLEILDLSDVNSFIKLAPQDKNLSMLKKLQTLDLSNTEITSLPILSNLPELRRLLLRGCKKLYRPSKLEQLPSLQILDLSDAATLKELNIDSHKGRPPAGPTASSVANLSELYLSGCSALEELPSTVNFTRLKILDVSGASKLEKFKDESFSHLNLLHTLNLSQTKITSLPSKSGPNNSPFDLNNLRFLTLKDCKRLATLPDFGGLKKLKELDLSGCVSLKTLPQLNSLQMLEILDLGGCSSLETFEDQSFENMSRLQKLILSETSIENLSSLKSSPNLSCLKLRNCINLKSLPPAENLRKLEVLDLDGVSTPSEINSGFLEKLDHIQNLHLFNIKFENFSFVSKLTTLRELSLKACSGLGVPCLEDLKSLEVLDFSDTDVTSLSSVEKVDRLRELLLRNCLNLESLPSLKLLTSLEKLDISGSGIKEFPYDISELANLTHLSMENMKDIKEVDWQRIQWLPEELNWGQLGISNFDNAGVDGKNRVILVSGTQFFQLLDPKLREQCLDHNFFCVYSPSKIAGEKKVCRWRNKSILNDAFFTARYFPRSSCRSLQLCGFESHPNGRVGVLEKAESSSDGVPKKAESGMDGVLEQAESGIDVVLEQAEFICLVENEFVKSISDLGEKLKPKGFWLERCQEMGEIFCEEKDANLGENLEILWVSSLLKLTSLYSEKIESLNFTRLEKLHLDCCPELEFIFPTSLELNNLKVLEVKFCDKLKSIFKNGGTVKIELPKLQKMLLLELPELTFIGASFPPKALHHSGCPKLELTESDSKGNASVEIGITRQK